MPRIACAQAVHADPLYLTYLSGFEEYRSVSATKTLVTAIQTGAPASYERAVKVLQAFEGVVEQATEDELANASGSADRVGLYICSQTGVALAVLYELIARGGHPARTSRGCHFHCPWPQVHALQGWVSRTSAGGGGGPVRQPAGGPAG